MSPDTMSSFILTTTSTTENKPGKHQVPLVHQSTDFYSGMVFIVNVLTHDVSHSYANQYRCCTDWHAHLTLEKAEAWMMDDKGT